MFNELLDPIVIKSVYSSTTLQRAMAFVQAMDNGSAVEASYLISHPNCKPSSARVLAWAYRSSDQVSQAISIYYKHHLPAWAQSKEGRACKLNDIVELCKNDKDVIDTARKAIMDVDHILEPRDKPQGSTVNIDMRSIILNDKQANSLSHKAIDQAPLPPTGGVEIER